MCQLLMLSKFFGILLCFSVCFLCVYCVYFYVYYTYDLFAVLQL